MSSAKKNWHTWGYILNETRRHGPFNSKINIIYSLTPGWVRRAAAPILASHIYYVTEAAPFLNLSDCLRPGLPQLSLIEYVYVLN
jgi:hypothetical protein